MIVIPTKKLLAVAKDAGFLFESFRDCGRRAAAAALQGISDIITISGIINRLADVQDPRWPVWARGHGHGRGRWQNRAIEAAQAAMASPLLESGAY